MTPILVFDLETIPDVVGLRQTNDWGDLSDLEVVERALAERHAKTGNTFLPHHLHKIAVIGCAFRDDNGFRVKCIGQADDPERNLIQGFLRQSITIHRRLSAGMDRVLICQFCITAALFTGWLPRAIGTMAVTIAILNLTTT